MKDIEKIIMNYSDMVYRIAFNYVANKSDAQDITQEVFIKLMGQNDLKHEDHIKAWLIRVTINQSKDHFKSFWNKKVDLSDETWIPRENQEAFTELFELPPEDRQVLYLSYFEGYKLDEIGRMLGMKPATVGTRIARAKAKLKQIILEGGQNEKRI